MLRAARRFAVPRHAFVSNGRRNATSWHAPLWAPEA
jgi:hypothetical protein